MNALFYDWMESRIGHVQSMIQPAPPSLINLMFFVCFLSMCLPTQDVGHLIEDMDRNCFRALTVVPNECQFIGYCIGSHIL